MEYNTTQVVQSTEVDWEFIDYAMDLEKEWKNSLPRFTDKELLGIFPEAKGVIPLKIMDRERELGYVINTIKRKLSIVHRKSAPENQWFWREVVKQLDGRKMEEIQRHLLRLRRQFAVVQNKGFRKGTITQEDIQQALTVSLVDIAAQRIKLRKTGKTFVGLCPFHNEKTPSFHIYHANNSFYCYGCQKGGNVITFVRELEGFSFREAIKYLTQ